MHIHQQSFDASIDPSNEQTIPMANYRFGSWQVAISRQPRAKEDLASHYDVASRNWQQMTRRYGFNAAHRRQLEASSVAAALGKVGSQATVLDCGIGSGTLSTALKSILSLTYADASFDFVMAAHVLEHLPEPLCALKGMVRVLKPGGMLFMCLTRRSKFAAFIQMRWRTWAIKEQHNVAFWARRPDGLEHIPETAATTNQEVDS